MDAGKNSVSRVRPIYFQASTGGLELYPLWKKGTTVQCLNLFYYIPTKRLSSLSLTG